MAKKKVDERARNTLSLQEPLPPKKPRRSSKDAVAEACGVSQDTPSAVSRHEKIALLAYGYWEQRGHHGGSPEEDWYRAEREIDLGSSTL